MAISESWSLRTRGRECAATQRTFNDGEIIITALFPDPESSGYLRRDFSIEGWDQRGTEDDQPFSFWRSQYHAPASADDKPQVFKKESAEELLKRLVEEDEDHTENARYILAVMLERQKLLRETDTQRTPTGILRVYEHRRNGDVYIVKDPNIPLSEVDKVQEEVIVLLENGGRQPVIAVEEAAAPEAPTPEEAPAAEEAPALEATLEASVPSEESDGSDGSEEEEEPEEE